MRLLGGLSVHSTGKLRPARELIDHCYRRRERYQDRRLSNKEETSRSFVPRNKDYRDRFKDISIKKILFTVAKISNYTVEELCSQGRPYDLVRWRQLFYRLCCDLTYYSMSEIGAALDRDHTTIRAGVVRFEKIADVDDEIRDAYHQVCQLLLTSADESI